MNFQELRAVLAERIDRSKPCAALGYVASSLQKGQTCKLHALQLAMKQTSSTFKDRPLSEIPPVCASDDPEYQKSHPIKSLRRLAKDKGFSSVGEIPSTEMLREIGRELNYDIDVRTEASLKGYIETLTKLIDEKLTPCVYFDVSFEPDSIGMPQVTSEVKKNEHAAVAVGYFTDKTDKKKYFILRHWDQFYIVDAVKLSISSGSLSEAPRGDETFYKCDERLIYPRDESAGPGGVSWFNLADHPLSEDQIQEIKALNPPMRTTAKDREDHRGSFRSCILTVKPAALLPSVEKFKIAAKKEALKVSPEVQQRKPKITTSV